MLVVSPAGLGVDGFAMAVGGGLSVLLLNFLFRLGVSSEADREEEEQARMYFDAHGEWPEDKPARGPPLGPPRRRRHLRAGAGQAAETALSAPSIRGPAGHAPDPMSAPYAPAAAPTPPSGGVLVAPRAPLTPRTVRVAPSRSPLTAATAAILVRRR